VNDRRQQLLAELAQLTGVLGPYPAAPAAPTPRPDADADAPPGLPEGPEIARTVERILDLFDQIHAQNRGLSEELLGYYEQLNTAFQATTIFALCKTVQQALPRLAQEIARAVHSRFTYYTGPWAQHLHRQARHIRVQGDLVFGLVASEDHAAARLFFERNESALRDLLAQLPEPAVAMIDHRGPEHYDTHGKGNVLALRLDADPTASSLPSALLLVRGDDQEPFAAVDLQLGDSLAKMGAAVLDNISYAQRLQRTSLQIVASLVRAVEAKDAYTSGHSNRVAQLACQLAQFIALPTEDVRLLEWAGLLHDIGKIGIRESVLAKPGRLTESEFAHIKTHPVQSCNVIEPIETLRSIHPIVRHHHEHWDGSGYPDGLKGPEIPRLARVLQIADVWDALTSTRPYRPAMSPLKASQVLQQEAGSTLDPELVASFLAMLQHRPPHESSLIPAPEST